MNGRVAVLLTVAVGFIVIGGVLVGFAYPRIRLAQDGRRRLSTCVTHAQALQDSARSLNPPARASAPYQPLVREFTALADSCAAIQSRTFGAVSPEWWARANTSGPLQYRSLSQQR